RKALDKYLEGALVPDMSELRVEHVEAELAGLRSIPLVCNEFEARIRVDEAPDEPGARNAIDVDAGSSDPNPAPVASEHVGVARRRRLRRLVVEPLAQSPEEPLCSLTPCSVKEIDGCDLLESPLEPSDVGLQLGATVVIDIQTLRRDLENLTDLA